jgi:transposase InsO family protein
MRKFIAYCDICQRVKHPNRAYEMEILSRLPKEPNELLPLDSYGPLPTGRGGARYLLVCFDIFSKHARLYLLKSATTKSCLNKLRYDYFWKHSKPQIILSDHGSQFTSSLWKNTLAALNIKVRYTPIRNPESNPTERVMRELGKYFRIYCEETHRKWPELVPNIQDWLNSSVIATTGYAPVELFNGQPRTNIFAEILK